MQDNPWSVNTYHSKRASHKVNDLGDIIGEDEAPENILEQPGWGSLDKLRFCVATDAAELDMPEADHAPRRGMAASDRASNAAGARSRWRRRRGPGCGARRGPRPALRRGGGMDELSR